MSGPNQAIHRCPECDLPPGTGTCGCGESFELFPLLACPVCGHGYNHARCEGCGTVAPFADWLDTARITPALDRAAREGEVVLRAQAMPRFPERCVICLRPRASGTMPVKALASSFASRWVYGWLLAPFLSRRVTIEAPACAPCAARFGRIRRLRWLLTWGSAFLAYGVARAAFQVDPSPARLIAAGAWGAGFIVSLFVLRSFIELEVDDSKGLATYTFDHTPYAVEFARLNG